MPPKKFHGKPLPKAKQDSNSGSIKESLPGESYSEDFDSISQSKGGKRVSFDGTAKPGAAKTFIKKQVEPSLEEIEKKYLGTATLSSLVNKQPKPIDSGAG